MTHDTFADEFNMYVVQGLVDVPFWGFGSHHLQISVGNYIPNTWVMFNWDIYQPLLYRSIFSLGKLSCLLTNTGIKTLASRQIGIGDTLPSQSHMLHGAGISTNIYPINDPNVGKYTIHGAYGKA